MAFEFDYDSVQGTDSQFSAIDFALFDDVWKGDYGKADTDAGEARAVSPEEKVKLTTADLDRQIEERIAQEKSDTSSPLRFQLRLLEMVSTLGALDNHRLLKHLTPKDIENAIDSLSPEQRKWIEQATVGSGKTGTGLLIEKFSLAMKLEALEGKFGKASQLAYDKINLCLNNDTLETYRAYAKLGKSPSIDGPISMPSIAGNLGDDKSQPATDTSFTKWILSDDFNLESLRKESEAKRLNVDLVFDTTKAPSRDDVLKFESLVDWNAKSSIDLNNRANRLRAEQISFHFKEQFGIDKAGWKPPANDLELPAYNRRADDTNTLLSLSVQYAETINALKVFGDYKCDALDQGVFPGKIVCDQDKQIVSIHPDVPESLASTPKNERRLQKLRDWLEKYRPGIDKTLTSNKTFGLLRYGEVHTGGQLNLDSEDRLCDNKDATKTLNYDYTFNKPTVTKVEKGVYEVTVDRTYYRDNDWNINYWMGSKVWHEKLGPIRFKENDLVPIQDNSGKVHFVKAKDLQAQLERGEFFHRAEKNLNAAISLPFVGQGVAAAKAAVTAGKWLYVGTNVTRAALGAMFVAEPALRQSEFGKSLLTFRNYAMTADVFQGVLKGGVKLTTGKSLDTAAQREVLKAIESSKSLDKIHKISGRAFTVYGAYLIPKLAEELHSETSNKQLDKNISLDQHRDPHSMKGAKVDFDAKPVFKDYSQQLLDPNCATIKEWLDATSTRLIIGKGLDEFKQNHLMEQLVPSRDRLIYDKFGGKEPKENHKNDQSKLAAAIGVILLAKQNGNELKLDTVIATRTIDMPPVRRLDPKTKQYVLTDTPQVVQNVTVRDALLVIEKAAIDADSPQARLIAADCLYKAGAWGPSRYHAVCQELLAQPTTPDNKQQKLELWIRATELAQQRALQESMQLSPSEEIAVDCDGYGLSSEKLKSDMQSLALKETDPDVRAMAALCLGVEKMPEGFDLAKYHVLFEENFAKPGRFFELVTGDINALVDKKMPAPDAAQIELARKEKLWAATVADTLNMPGKPEIIERRKLNESVAEALCLSNFNSREGKAPDLETTIQCMDYLLKNRATLTKEQAEMLQRAALEVLQTPYNSDPETARARIEVIQRLPELLSTDQGGNPSWRILIANELSGCLSSDSIRNGWGQFPDMRAAAIKGLTVMGSTAPATLASIAALFDVDPFTGLFRERGASVRIAALEMFYQIGPHAFKSGLGDKSSLDIDKLLSRERDPNVVRTLREVKALLSVPAPGSIEELTNYSNAMEKISSADYISIDENKIEQFLGKYEKVSLLDKKSRAQAIKSRSGQVMETPSENQFLWRIFESKESLKNVNVRAKEAADGAASQEVNKSAFEQIDNLGDLANFDEADREQAIKTLILIIRDSERNPFDGEQLVEARRKAAEAVRKICLNKTYPNGAAMKKQIESMLLQTDKQDHQVTNVLLDCVDALTSDKAGPVESGKFSRMEAGFLYLKTLERQYSQIPAAGDKSQKNCWVVQKRYRSWEDTQVRIMTRLYDLRFHAGAGEYRALCGDPRRADWFKGSQSSRVRECANEVMEGLEFGVAHIKEDVKANKADLRGTMAGGIKLALKDSSFNYSRACAAIFQSVEGLPITESTDQRREVLHKCLKHPNERVRLAAAIALAESKVSEDIELATTGLIDLAASGSQKSYKQEASSIIAQILPRMTLGQRRELVERWEKATAKTASPKKVPAVFDMSIFERPYLPGEEERTKVLGIYKQQSDEIEAIALMSGLLISQVQSAVYGTQEEYEHAKQKYINEKVGTIALKFKLNTSVPCATHNKVVLNDYYERSARQNAYKAAAALAYPDVFRRECQERIAQLNAKYKVPPLMVKAMKPGKFAAPKLSK